MTMLWILLVVALLLVILRMMFRWKNRRLVAVQKQLALDGIDLPFIGHIYKFMGSDEDRMKAMVEFGKEAYRKTGCLAEFQGPYLFVLVADPEAADVLLKTCLEKIDLVRMFRVLLGNGSIFAPVSIWRPRRKILAPTFSQKNLNSFVNVFSQQSSIMGDQLRKVAGKGVFSVWKYLTTYTMDSVCETTLGIQVRSQMEPELPFLRAFENCCQIDAKRIFQPWRYNDTVNKIIYNSAFKSYARSKEMMWKFMHKIISSKWEDLKKQKQLGSAAEAHTNNWKTFLQMLIESEAGYGDVELREETLVLVLAGTDTSAVGSAFTLMMLAKYPDVQEKVYEELQEIFGNSDRPVTHEDLPRLKYLDAVIKESLRLYPPVPIITRRVEKDVTLPSGVTLVNGCNLLIFIWSIHRNPKYWGDDADLFRPERFIDAPPMHPAAFMPFSYGPRSCLGYQYAMMSMKTALAVLLRRYRVISSERKNGTSETNDHPRKPNLRVQFDIMLKHVDNFEIQLELRK